MNDSLIASASKIVFKNLIDRNLQMNEKKVSITINIDNYHRLSDYSRRYGTSIRHMLHLLLDDSIENDRYLEIFGKRHNMSHIRDTVIDSPNDIKTAPKKDNDEKPLRDLTIDTSISESDEIIDAINKEFNDNKSQSSNSDFDSILEDESCL